MSVEGKEEGIVVIGAGLSRTGTLSSRAAFEQLLGGPCYHGVVPVVEQRQLLPLWEEAIQNNELSASAKEQLLGGYKAGVDYPFNQFWRQMLDIYPSAKVVLTVRDHQNHYRSLANLMGPNGHFTDETRWPMSWFNKLLGTPWPFLRCEGTWKSPNTGMTLYQAVHTGEKEGIQFFKDWEEDVRTGVPEDRLLVFRVQDGWGPLCSFLGLPEPDCPFPNVNDTRAINLIATTFRVCAWLAVVVFPFLLAGLGYFLINTSSPSSLLLLSALAVGCAFLAKMYAENYLKAHVDNSRKKAQ